MDAETQKAFNILTIVAIVVGPILALMAQRWLDIVREKRKRRLQLFHSLLTSRAMPLSIEHVRTLNSIELEFYPRRGKNKAVIDAWRTYLDHLNTPRPTDAVGSAQNWDARSAELSVDLIYQMSQSVGYDFDRSMIKRGAYYPAGLGNMENEQAALRQAALKVFEGNTAIRVQSNRLYRG
jgi:hypothetical protein